MKATVRRPVMGEAIVQIDGLNPLLQKHYVPGRARWCIVRKAWLVPRSKALAVAEHLARFGDVEVFIDGHATQKCDTRCTQAKGSDCVCSCAGSNHRGTRDGWMQVGATTLISSDVTRAHYRIEAA